MHHIQSIRKQLVLAGFTFGVLLQIAPFQLYLPFINPDAGPIGVVTGVATIFPGLTLTPTATATLTPPPIPTATSTPTPTVVPAPCACTGNLYNCRDFATQPAAQACYEYCLAQTGRDIHRLDADDDGVACELLDEDRMKVMSL